MPRKSSRSPTPTSTTPPEPSHLIKFDELRSSLSLITQVAPRKKFKGEVSKAREKFNQLAGAFRRKQKDYHTTLNAAIMSLGLRTLLLSAVDHAYGGDFFMEDNHFFVFNHLLNSPELQLYSESEPLLSRGDMLALINTLLTSQFRLPSFIISCQAAAVLLEKGMKDGLVRDRIQESYRGIEESPVIIEYLGLRARDAHFIKACSQKNITRLNEAAAIDREDDGLKEIHSFLLDEVTWVATHATNAARPILRDKFIAGTRVMSETLGGTLLSEKSSDVNKEKLGNEDFVFFRVTAGLGEMVETRYGLSTFVFNLKDLAENSWISLHDQAMPFSRPNSTAITHDGVRIREIHYEKDKLCTNWKIKYPGCEANNRKISFAEEIFYDEDIIPGIVKTIVNELSKIKKASEETAEEGSAELRAQQASGNYYKEVLRRITELKATGSPSEKDSYAAELLKTFVRPELKVPVGVELTTRPPIFVHNPAGIGLYDHKYCARILGAHRLYQEINRRESVLRSLIDKNPIGEPNLKIQEQLKELAGCYRKISKYLEDSPWEEKVAAIQRMNTVIKNFLRRSGQPPEALEGLFILPLESLLPVAEAEPVARRKSLQFFSPVAPEMAMQAEEKFLSPT